MWDGGHEDSDREADGDLDGEGEDVGGESMADGAEGILNLMESTVLDGDGEEGLGDTEEGEDVEMH